MIGTDSGARGVDMTVNMGNLDRWLRGIVVAPLLAVFAFVVGLGLVLGVIALVLAVVMAATATVGFCPLYVPLHLRTNRQHPAH